MIQLTMSYGSTTVDLMSGGRIALDGYAPEVSDDGNPVTDRVELWLTGSATAMKASLRSIELALEHARQHPDDADGCWVNYAINATETPYRSRVINGAVLHDARLDARWRAGRAKISLVLTRRPYWEGPETAVPLSNPNGTNLTSGINVFNCNDGSGVSPNQRRNYVEIAAASVDGNLPAPVRLLLTNTYAANRLNDVWIGHNYTDPAAALWNLEAETATGETGTIDAGSSGGYVVSKTLTSDAETVLFTWPLSAAMLSAARGQWVHAVGRWAYATTLPNIRFRLKILWNLTEIWRSDQVLPSSLRAIAVRDLAAFRLPPWLQASSDLDGLSLVLTGQRISSNNQLTTLDFLYLMPADGFRFLTCVGYGVAQGSRIVDDGISGELYRDSGSGIGRVGVLSGYGEPILLLPNKLQRLYFMQHSNILNTAEIDRSLSVQAVYRPRRSSL